MCIIFQMKANLNVSEMVVVISFYIKNEIFADYLML